MSQIYSFSFNLALFAIYIIYHMNKVPINKLFFEDCLSEVGVGAEFCADGG